MEDLNKDNKSDFDIAFAPVIFEIVKAIKKKESNSKLRQELKAALNVTLQKYTNFETQMVSEKAYNFILNYNKENNTNYNPFNLNFDQHRMLFGKIDQKNKIMWEHVIPISNTIEQFEQENKFNSMEEILEYLIEYPGTCLITRGEDNELNKEHKTKRTKETWKNIYEEKVKITIKTRSYFLNDIILEK